MNDQKNQSDCGCEGNCCEPKKKSVWPKIVFAVVILAALSIIAVKLFTGSPDAQAAGQKGAGKADTACCASGGSSACDTTKSSCCSK